VLKSGGISIPIIEDKRKDEKETVGGSALKVPELT
jgi:hypothetical protein